MKHLAVILLLATIFAITIRVLVFETIRVATPAMSENQIVGNRLIIEKWSLGSRLPVSIGIPFAPDTLFGKQTYYRFAKYPLRLPGFGMVKRNDLLAFNALGKGIKPIDRGHILLSRCVGLPGEHLLLRGVKLFVNEVEIQRHPDVSVCYRYPIGLQKALTAKLDSERIRCETYLEKDSGYIYLTRYQYYALAKQSDQRINLKLCTSSFDEKNVVIPFKGFRIKLNDRAFKTWENLINRFEGILFERTANGRYLINGKEIEYYTFKQNYYWLLNDHQGYLSDSRSFGLVPESQVIGKAYLVFFSPKNKRFLQII